MPAAATLYAMIQQVSLTVGIPISAGVLSLARAAQGGAAPSVEAFALAFVVVAGISALAVPASLLLPRGTGAEMSGRREA